MKTMYDGKINSPSTTLDGAILIGATSMTLVDATVLPPAPNICTIGNGVDAETVTYSDITGNVVTIARAFQGTAKGWDSGTIVARNFTEYDYDALKDNVAELETEKLAKVADLATQVQAEAGTDNTKYMTPLRTKEALDTLGVHAWQVLDTVVLANSTTATVNLTVPATGDFNFLRVLIKGANSSASTRSLMLQFNGDSAANQYNNGGTSFAATYIELSNCLIGNADAQSLIDILITNATNTDYQPVVSMKGTQGFLAETTRYGGWTTKTRVSTIDFKLNGDNFRTGSTFVLIGSKT